MNQITWLCKHFNELTNSELYALLRLRSEVFVVEQSCVFLDLDNHDQNVFHLLGYRQHDLAAYARLIQPGITYQEISIGRVVTSPKFRRNGVGKALMTTAVEKCGELFGRGPIKIGAQLYLKQFYQNFGFNQISEVYIEDEIPHIKMLRP